MDTKTITIQGHEVSIPVRYAEGHTLNANEANALNQLLLENVRNNVAGKIKKAADEAKVKPEEVNLDSATVGEGEDKTTLRDFINTYAGNYEFGARPVRSSTPLDPVEREALRYAKEQVRKALAAKKIKVKDLPEGKYDELVESFAEREDTIKEAKRRVKAAESAGDLELDLGDVEPASES